jgi:hypothetical protein
MGLLLSTAGHAQTVVNGNFGTGNLTGFTVFTTPNGSNGPGLPNVVSFDVTGSGATNAAHFDVGQVVFATGVPAGGGIFQDVNFTSSGVATFAADIAAQGAPSENAEAGIFELLVDNVVLSTVDFGDIPAFTIDRATLNGSTFVSAGSHELRILIERPFLNQNGATPDQYVTNIRASSASSVTPEGSSLFLMIGGLFPLAATALWRRKRAMEQSP